MRVRGDILRSGTGTLRRFFGDAGAVVIAIERERGVAAFMCDDALARVLIREYGAQQDDSVDMSHIIGLPVSFKENAAGVLVCLRVLAPAP
jgi:hypothetical protein